ncbi:MAG: hypothetical protein GW795_01225 [Cyanobacteria bacterium]|nr:hypothetical protein [Cyanobacteria bacterium CG_2015-04_32_10]
MIIDCCFIIRSEVKYYLNLPPFDGFNIRFRQVSGLIPLPFALCPLLFALCPLLFALCPLPFTLCPLPFTLCPLLFTPCPLPLAHCPLPIAHCPLPHGRFYLELRSFSCKYCQEYDDQ